MHYKIKSLNICCFLTLVLFSGAVSAADPKITVDNSADIFATELTPSAEATDFFGFDDGLPSTLPAEEVVIKEDVLIEEKSKPALLLPPEEVVSAAPTPISEPVKSAYSKVVDDELFSKMSDLEKQSALLTLQLRKEKIQNDIDAVKNQRTKAIEEEKLKKELEAEKRREKAQEEQRKMLVEQQKLKEQEIALEKLRQEKLLKSYKDSMLEAKQDWIAKNAELYKVVTDAKQSQLSVFADLKNKMSVIKQSVDGADGLANEVKAASETKVSDLQTQISVLKTRLEAEENQNKVNPFALKSSDDSVAELVDNTEKLEDMYAIMEIRGKGNKLIAKLLNNTGQSFLAQVGTTLQSGHIVDEISNTYIRVDKAGKKEYIYFAAGGILDKEPLRSTSAKAVVEEESAKESAPVLPTRQISASRGLPGIAKDMVVQ